LDEPVERCSVVLPLGKKVHVGNKILLYDLKTTH
jgi:hypothetical protein